MTSNGSGWGGRQRPHQQGPVSSRYGCTAPITYGSAWKDGQQTSRGGGKDITHVVLTTVRSCCEGRQWGHRISSAHVWEEHQSR